MYKYVSNATVKPYRSFCADKLNQLKQMLESEHDLKTDFYLVGSGAKNRKRKFNLQILKRKGQAFHKDLRKKFL